MVGKEPDVQVPELSIELLLKTEDNLWILADEQFAIHKELNDTIDLMIESHDKSFFFKTQESGPCTKKECTKISTQWHGQTRWALWQVSLQCSCYAWLSSIVCFTKRFCAVAWEKQMICHMWWIFLVNTHQQQRRLQCPACCHRQMPK